MEMRPEKEFTEAFEYASGKSADRVQNPLWFITETFFGAKMRQSLRIVRRFGQEIVAKAVNDRSNLNSSDSEAKSEKDGKLEEVSGTLIQSLLDALNDEKVVADAALNYLSAGRSHPLEMHKKNVADFGCRERHNSADTHLDFLRAHASSSVHEEDPR
jgi:hypothetical protein